MHKTVITTNLLRSNPLLSQSNSFNFRMYEVAYVDDCHQVIHTQCKLFQNFLCDKINKTKCTKVPKFPSEKCHSVPRLKENCLDVPVRCWDMSFQLLIYQLQKESTSFYETLLQQFYLISHQLKWSILNQQQGNQIHYSFISGRLIQHFPAGLFRQIILTAIFRAKENFTQNVRKWNF